MEKQDCRNSALPVANSLSLGQEVAEARARTAFLSFRRRGSLKRSVAETVRK